MAAISYHSIGGQIRSIASAAMPSQKTELLRDAIGSVVRTTTLNGSAGLTQRFASYGSRLAAVPQLGTDARSGWAGSWGYRRSSLPFSDEYVRARHLSSVAGSWSTRDRIWPRQPAYGYMRGRPHWGADPSGLGGCPGDGCCCQPTSLTFEKPELSFFYNEPSPICPGTQRPLRSGSLYKMNFSTGVGSIPNDPNAKTDCKLRWCECRDEPWSATGANGVWKEWDLSTLGPHCREQVSDWTNVHGANWNCGSSNGRLIDAPSMTMRRLQDNATKHPGAFPINLFITVVIEPGKGCNGKLTLKVLQTFKNVPGGSLTDSKNPMFPSDVKEGFSGDPMPGPASCQNAVTMRILRETPLIIMMALPLFGGSSAASADSSGRGRQRVETLSWSGPARGMAVFATARGDDSISLEKIRALSTSMGIPFAATMERVGNASPDLVFYTPPDPKKRLAAAVFKDEDLSRNLDALLYFFDLSFSQSSNAASWCGGLAPGKQIRLSSRATTAISLISKELEFRMKAKDRVVLNVVCEERDVPSGPAKGTAEDICVRYGEARNPVHRSKVFRFQLLANGPLHYAGQIGELPEGYLPPDQSR